MAQTPWPTRQALWVFCWRILEKQSCVRLPSGLLLLRWLHISRYSLVLKFLFLSCEMMQWITSWVPSLLLEITLYQVNLLFSTWISSHLVSFIECCLYFNHTLYRGNRVTKMSSYDLSAFDSPNFPPLVKGEYPELAYLYLTRLTTY